MGVEVGSINTSVTQACGCAVRLEPDDTMCKSVQ